MKRDLQILPVYYIDIRHWEILVSQILISAQYLGTTRFGPCILMYGLTENQPSICGIPYAMYLYYIKREYIS